MREVTNTVWFDAGARFCLLLRLVQMTVRRQNTLVNPLL